MASIKVKYRPSTVCGKEGCIYFQVIHGRIVRQIKVCGRIFDCEWNAWQSTVEVAGTADTGRRKYLAAVKDSIDWGLKRLKSIVAFLDRQNRTYTADEVVEKFCSHEAEQTLFHFMQGVIGQLKQLNRVRTSEAYASALSSFMRFRGGQDILLCEIDGDTMMLYEAWMKGNGICPNTVSFYMRILRAVYNRAVEKELIEQWHPFRHVYTGIDKTVKRAVPLKVIRRIKELDLALRPHIDYARDMFLFSFYTRGMSFIDMAYLRKSDLKNGMLTYRRKKTAQQLVIKWERCMEEIVAKYRATYDTEYLLPIITNPLGDVRRQYRNAIFRVNSALKEVARVAGLAVPLTMYCARHSWASAAKSKNIPIAVISEGMGHDSEETTRIYLASLDTNVVDRANRLILKDL